VLRLWDLTGEIEIEIEIEIAAMEGL